MDNWLLIIVGTIFLICIAFGYVRGFLKLGLSLLSTILTLVLVLFLSPHVTRALKAYTPVDDFLESKVTEKFMPEITSEQLQSIDLTGTPLENLTAEDISKLNEMDWDVLGITADDILSVIGDIPKDVQIAETEYEPAAGEALIPKLSAKHPTAQLRPEGEALERYKVKAAPRLEQAAKLIAEAQKPLIYCGGGVILSGAESELLAFADRVDAPVVSTLMGLGAVPADNPRTI